MSIIPSISEDARAIWQAGVAAVDPVLRIKQFVATDDRGISIGAEVIRHTEYRNVVVVGAGKSSGAMAAALDEILEALPEGKQVVGQVNVPDNHVLSLKRINVVGCRPVGINLPTERVLTATDSIIDLLQQCDANDLVIGLFSGGGSALLERTVAGVSLNELQQLTSTLSQQGASIEEINCVRSQLSQVKGGGLARMIASRKVVSLLISDVLGDPIEAIASGPTWISSTEADLQRRVSAVDVIARYAQRSDSIPDSILRELGSKERQVDFRHRHQPEVKHVVIANNQVAVEAAFLEARSLGYQGRCETDFTSTRADIVARQFMHRLKVNLARAGSSAPKGCWISGGEPTVVVENSSGRGGRNQHLVLAAIESILADPIAYGSGQFSFLSAGTDGEDGNTAVAGAQFNSSVLGDLRIPEAIQLAQQHLRNSDSHSVLKQWACLFQAHDSNTNVCDLRVLLWKVKE